MSDPTPDLGQMVAMMPFAELLGIELDTATAEEVRGRVPWAAEKCTTFGLLHGGVLMAAADTVGAVCAFLNLPAGALTTTIESKTNFFRGLRAGRAFAVTTPLHVGRTTIVVQTDIRDADDRRLALVTQTQAVLTG